MDALTYLQPKERSEYEALRQMFQTEGWQVLQQKLKDAEDFQVLACASAEDEKHLYRGQGRLVFLREMRNYEQSVEHGIEALCAERQLEAEVDNELGSPGNDG